MERGKKEDWAERSSDLSAILRRSHLAQGKGEATESDYLLEETFAGQKLQGPRTAVLRKSMEPVLDSKALKLGSVSSLHTSHFSLEKWVDLHGSCASVLASIPLASFCGLFSFENAAPGPFSLSKLIE